MLHIPVRLAVCACILVVSAVAQQSRITEPINDTARVILPGSVPFKARLSADQGPANPSLQIPFITVTMKPSAAQQADLDHLLEEQRDRSSSKFHQWLTPEQFGDRFGLTSGRLCRCDRLARIAWSARGVRRPSAQLGGVQRRRARCRRSISYPNSPLSRRWPGAFRQLHGCLYSRRSSRHRQRHSRAG